MNAEEVGKIAMHLGAGREKKEDNIDYSVGIELCKKVDDHIENGDTVAFIYANNEEKGKLAVEKLKQNYIICDHKAEKIPDILEVVK